MSAADLRRFATEGGGVICLFPDEIAGEWANLIRKGELTEIPSSSGRAAEHAPENGEHAASPEGEHDEPELASTGEPDAENASTGAGTSSIPMPALTDDKGVWIEYGVSRGMTHAEASRSSRREIHDRFAPAA